MEIPSVEEPAKNGAVSAGIAVLVTYGVAQVYPTSDLVWTLTAVGLASYFSGFFSSHYSS